MNSKKPKKSVGTMNVILVIVGVCLLVFTVYMIELYKLYGAVPDTLVTCVFACLGGECGVMGWIKTSKDKRQEREWTLEDEKRHKEDEKTGGDEPPTSLDEK